MIKKFLKIYRNHKEVINYLIFGLLTTAVSLCAYYSCVLTFLDPASSIQLQLANVISWVAAVTFAYVTNRKYVFDSKNKNILQEATTFYLSRVSTLLMDMGIMFVGCTLCGFNDKIVKLVVQMLVMLANYVLSKILVFRRK